MALFNLNESKGSAHQPRSGEPMLIDLMDCVTKNPKHPQKVKLPHKPQNDEKSKVPIHNSFELLGALMEDPDMSCDATGIQPDPIETSVMDVPAPKGFPDIPIPLKCSTMHTRAKWKGAKVRGSFLSHALSACGCEGDDRFRGQ